MGVLSKLRVTHPMPVVLIAQALPQKSQQGFWGSAHAGEEQMSPDIALALVRQRFGDHLWNPGTARPVGLDVLRCFYGP